MNPTHLTETERTQARGVLKSDQRSIFPKKLHRRSLKWF